MKKLVFLVFLFGFIACKNNDSTSDNGPDANATPIISHSIIQTYPHDTSSFTEGLLIYKGKLYESTGLEGRSKLIESDLQTGKAIRSINLDSKYFGEGIVIVNDTVYQLTYKTQVGFKYALKDFKKLGEFTYEAKEGWGMTTDGKSIIASDGTSNLYFYQPGTFKLLKVLAVTEGGAAVSNINELEYIDGYIYSNQWQYSYILKIDPNNGQVVGKIDLTKTVDAVKSKYPFVDSFNGIAYDSSSKKIYVTGKNWPELYEVQFSK